MLFYYGSSDEVFEAKHIDLPPERRCLLLPSAKAFITKGKFGWILSQYIGEKDIEVWQHHFFIEHPCTLFAHNKEPVITINYMLEGSPYIKLQGKHESLLNPGTYRMFYVPAISHKVSFIEGTYHSIHINYQIPVLEKAVSGSTRLTMLFNTLIHEDGKITPYQAGNIDMHIRLRLSELLWGGDETSNKNRVEHSRRLILGYILKHHIIKDDLYILEKFIKRNLHEKLDIVTLMRFCGKSRSELFRLFRKQYRTTPAQYIREERLRKAKKLIESTPLPLLQIAILVGFDSLSYFSKVFKSLFKIAPKDCRT